MGDLAGEVRPGIRALYVEAEEGNRRADSKGQQQTDDEGAEGQAARDGAMCRGGQRLGLVAGGADLVYGLAVPQSHGLGRRLIALPGVGVRMPAYGHDGAPVGAGGRLALLRLMRQGNRLQALQ